MLEKLMQIVTILHHITDKYPLMYNQLRNKHQKEHLQKQATVLIVRIKEAIKVLEAQILLSEDNLTDGQ